MIKVLILVVSSEQEPYGKMIQTSLNTWDSIEVEGCETIYYCGKSHNKDTDKILHFQVKETYQNMGHKMLMAIDWALANKEFDYIARVNSSCYVDKKKLMEYCQSLPEEKLFSGIQVDHSSTNHNEQKWIWGGGYMIISKDVIEKISYNKIKWNHSIMEDVAMSFLINELDIPFHSGKSCSLNETTNGWLLIGYGGQSIEFSDFNDLIKLNNHFYRVKIDRDREVDKYLMEELYKVLK